MEKAGEATLEVAKEETPKAKGSKEESQAAMTRGQRYIKFVRGDISTA